ncbi:sulfurtransferase TusA family protein [Pelagibacterium sp.]|uniref:sulfurtransferase TusA family protein n=1 Tax=Pelagibacterium sp. TaxID=1967288 RepID=UPI003A92D3E0
MSDTVIDARGLKCPLPVLKLEKVLAGTSAGESIAVLANDPVARIDIPLYCQLQGHGLEMHDEKTFIRFVVTKVPDPESAG